MIQLSLDFDELYVLRYLVEDGILFESDHLCDQFGERRLEEINNGLKRKLESLKKITREERNKINGQQ